MRKLQSRGLFLIASLFVLSSFAMASGPWTQIAKLTASDSVALGALAVSGDTAIAPGGGSVYVFVKPASGWVSMTETAKLSAPFGLGSVAIDGNTVAAGPARGYAACVFLKPVSGWSTTSTCNAILSVRTPKQYAFLTSIAVSGDTVVAGSSVRH